MGRGDDLAAIDVALTRIARVAMSRAATRARAERSGVDLNPLAVNVLAVIYRRGPSRLGKVAEVVDIQPSRVSKEIAQLRRRGYVVGQTDPDDHRATQVSLTPRGRRAFARYRRAADQLLEETVADWDDGRLRQLAALLGALAKDFSRDRH